MTPRVRVLLVLAAGDAAAGDAATDVRGALERERDGLDVDVATTAEDALARLDADGYDCVLAGHPLPDATSSEFLESVRDRHPRLPFVLATDVGSQALASDAVHRGVTEYVPNPIAVETAGDLSRVVRDAVEGAEARERRAGREYPSDDERRETARRFREIAELSPDAIFRIETDGTLRYVSPATETLLGYAPDDVVGEDFAMLVADDSLDTALEGFQRVVDGEVVRDLPVVLERADDGSVDVEVSASPVFRGDDVHVVQGFARDVTERRERERRLHRQEALLENSPDAFYVVDATGEITYQSRPSADVLGYERRDLVGESVLPHVHPEDRDAVLADFEYLLEHPTTAVTTEYRYRNADGDWRVMENRAVDLLDDPDVEGILVVNRDVTDRHERKRELEATNDRLERFASVVSHDLRNPLAVATGAIDLAAADRDDANLDRAADALDRMDAIIESVLAVARHGTDHLDPTPVDLHHAVRRSLRTLDLQDATVQFDANATIHADDQRLAQLLENLLRNAVEHGSPDADDGVTITVGALEDGFYVEDDGPGIPEGERDAVLDIGYTTSASGTGYGLAIVADVAREHGWTVSVEETDAGGARFAFHGGTVE